MKRYYVVTPEYEYQSADWYEPPEYGRDAIEVEAPNKRAAIIAGVKKMLTSRNRREFRWCHDQRGDGCNPFAGVKAFEIVPEMEPT